LWLVFWLFAVAGGTLASWAFWGLVAVPQLDALASRLEILASRPTTSSTVSVIETPTAAVTTAHTPRTPSILLARHSSVVRVVVRTAARPAVSSREAGSAVALSSDGWFLTAASVIHGQKLADLSLLVDGKTLSVTQGFRDPFTDLVFLKAAATNQSPADVLRAEDVVAGIDAYLEPVAKRLYPTSVVDVREQATSTPATSEFAARRFLLAMPATSGWEGGAVWDEDGRLLGIVEGGSAEGARVIPAADALGVLSAVFAGRDAQHATLGGRILGTTGAVPGAVQVIDKKGMNAVFQVGDVIERLERDILDGTAGLGERLLDYRPGAQVTLYGTRKNAPMQWTVTLGAATGTETLK
jgi:S1-C subfamily serine protease